MARRIRSVRVGGYVRPTFWGRSPSFTVPVALGSGIALLDSSAVGVAEGETIVRIRGDLFVRSDQQAATEETNGAVGACIVTDQAFAVGVGSIPTPYSDQDSDVWMLHQYWASGFNSNVDGDMLSFQRFSFDSKAMRKLPDGSTFVFVIENAASGAGVQYYLNYAVLFKPR